MVAGLVGGSSNVKFMMMISLTIMTIHTEEHCHNYMIIRCIYIMIPSNVFHTGHNLLLYHTDHGALR